MKIVVQNNIKYYISWIAVRFSCLIRSGQTCIHLSHIRNIHTQTIVIHSAIHHYCTLFMPLLMLLLLMLHEHFHSFLTYICSLLSRIYSIELTRNVRVWVCVCTVWSSIHTPCMGLKELLHFYVKQLNNAIKILVQHHNHSCCCNNNMNRRQTGKRRR